MGPSETATTLQPVRAVYDGPGITTLVPALLGAADASWLPAPVAGATSVVVLVLDGLGWEALERHPELLPTIRALEGTAVTSVVPSTTAAALTSITTGLAPSEHGLLGFRMRAEGGILNVLSWHTEGKKHAPDPGLVQRHAPVRGRPVPVVTRSEVRATGFSEAHLRGGEFPGWRAVSTIVEHCRALALDGAPFVYAYYPGVDEVAHSYGLQSRYYRAELAFADRLVADVLDALPESSALVVTADHGQVDLVPEAWIELGDVSELVEECAGDARFRYLYALRGAAAELLAGAQAAHGSDAWVMSREQLEDEAWLGPKPSNAIRRRIGDVVLASTRDVGFVDPALPRETRLRSGHGSLTEAEMMVPLVAGRGRGRSTP
jgi:hypothetical protein